MPRRNRVPDRVLTPYQASAIGRVSTDTLRKWEKKGIVTSLRSGSGKHRRYLESEVRKAARKWTGERWVNPRNAWE